MARDDRYRSAYLAEREHARRWRNKALELGAALVVQTGDPRFLEVLDDTADRAEAAGLIDELRAKMDRRTG